MAQLTRLSRLITICQRVAKAIPLISDTDRAETSGTDRADCDGTRFAGPPFWRMPQPVLRSVAFPSEGPSIRELFFGASRGRPCSRFLGFILFGNSRRSRVTYGRVAFNARRASKLRPRPGSPWTPLLRLSRF